MAMSSEDRWPLLVVTEHGSGIVSCSRLAATTFLRRRYKTATAAIAIVFVGAVLFKASSGQSSHWASGLRGAASASSAEGAVIGLVQGAATHAVQRTCLATGPLRSSRDPNRCISIDATTTVLGARLILWHCLHHFPNEQFLLPAEGTRGPIRWAEDPNLCLDVTNGGTSVGTPLQIYTCFPGSANQEFVVTPGGNGPIHWAKHSEMCLGVSGSLAGPVALAHCTDAWYKLNITNPFKEGPLYSSKSAPSIDDCMGMCEGTIGCRGAEYHETEQQCKIWTHRTRAVVSDENSSCLLHKTACITSGPLGVGPNHACVFPFQYEGQVYHSCTFVGSTAPWCSTKVDEKGNHMLEHWGYCDCDSCSCGETNAQKPAMYAGIDKAVTGAPIRLRQHGESCLTVHSRGMLHPAEVRLQSCKEGRPEQQFTMGNGPIRWAPHPDWCLTVPHMLGSRASDTLIMEWCEEGNPWQIFSVPDFPGQIHWVDHTSTGPSLPHKCLSSLLGATFSGNAVVLWDCGDHGGPGGEFETTKEVVPPKEFLAAYQQGDLLYTNSESSVAYQPEIGNGFMATVVGSDALYAAGVFNGCLYDENGKTCSISPSRRARIPAPLRLQLEGTVAGAALDLRGGSYIRMYEDGLRLRFYAHRARRSLLVVELSRSGNSAAAQAPLVQLAARSDDPPSSEDFHWTQKKRIVSGQEVLIWSGTTLLAELKNVKLVQVVVVLPAGLDGKKLEIKAGAPPIAIVAALRTSLEVADPEVAAVADWQSAATLSASTLLADHEAAWAQLWRSGFEVQGRMDVARAVNSSLYYILSSVREDMPQSLSPGGLASNSYNGHTFWDTEIWMYPPMVLWHPSLAASLLQYRVDRLDQAHAKALGYDRNYTGAMFPWESAATGTEECPDWAPFGDLEQHITGDIAFAQQQLWRATGNLSQLRSAYPALLNSTAAFWASRVNWTSNSSAHIQGIVPPDEDTVGDDSPYTNFVVQRNLLFASEAAELIGEQADPEWARVAAALPILFDNELGIHPEHKTWTDARIKQADVVLLGFPLMLDMPTSIRRSDLEYYAKRTDPNGPAMTWGMHATGYLELGDAARASENFNRSFANVQRPFGVWTETPSGGAINFITGAGGFLQTVLYGLPGLRIKADHLELNPSFVEGMTSVTVRGLHYQGSVLWLSYNSSATTLRCETGPEVEVTDKFGTVHAMQVGQQVTIPSGKARVRETKK